MPHEENSNCEKYSTHQYRPIWERTCTEGKYEEQDCGRRGFELHHQQSFGTSCSQKKEKQADLPLCWMLIRNVM